MEMGLVILVLFGVEVWFGIQWVLGPLHRAGGNRECPAQFALADLMCLFILAARSMGGIHSLLHSAGRNRESVPEGLVYYLDSLAVVAVALAWWDAVRALSRGGIRKQWQRFLVIVVAVPFAFLGPTAAILLFCVAISGIPSRLAVGLLLSGSAITSAVFVAGVLTRRCVASVDKIDHVDKQIADGLRPFLVALADKNGNVNKPTDDQESLEP